MERPDYFNLKNGNKSKLPFSKNEYERRLKGLREIMSQHDLEMVLLTSMHGVAYYSGFLYTSFGRPYGCVVTHEKCITISANLDAGQPWRRSIDENIIYTDWKRDNFLKALVAIVGRKQSPKKIGIETDHLIVDMHLKIKSIFTSSELINIANDAMKQRMVKSKEEIELIKNGSKVADVGARALVKKIKAGVKEIEIAQVGRDAMELEISRLYPDSELRDTWVWFQSGINTDGAHNHVTSRKLQKGDILSLNTFPMISGYYTALERTLFLEEIDDDSLKAWEANVKVHKRGLELIKPGAKCSEITNELNDLFAQLGYLHRRTFGYGHSFGILSPYYGREAGLEFREDIQTVLEPGMVVSMEPMVFIPEGEPGAGGYREHDILVVKEKNAENITTFPFGPKHNIIKN